jgi:hypothetical protein
MQDLGSQVRDPTVLSLETAVKLDFISLLSLYKGISLQCLRKKVMDLECFSTYSG